MNIYETYFGSLYLPCMGRLTHYLMAYCLYCVVFVHDTRIPMHVFNIYIYIYFFTVSNK